MAACARRIPVPEKPSEETAKLAREITCAVQSRMNLFKGVQTEAELKVHYPGEDLRSDAALIEWRPGNIRLECLGLFDQPVLSLAVNGEHFDVLSVANMSCYTGLTSARSVARYIPKEIQIQDIFAWLMGEHNFAERRAISFEPQIDNPSLLVVSFWNERTQAVETVWFEPTETIIRKVRITDSRSREIVTVQNSGLLKQGGITYPGTVTISMPHGITLQVNYRNFVPLKDKPEGIFSIPCPPGFKCKDIR